MKQKMQGHQTISAYEEPKSTKIADQRKMTFPSKRMRRSHSLARKAAGLGRSKERMNRTIHGADF